MEVSDWRAKYESAVHEIQMLKDILSQQGIQFNIFRDTTMGPGTQQPATPTGESGGSYDESVLDD